MPAEEGGVGAEVEAQQADLFVPPDWINVPVPVLPKYSLPDTDRLPLPEIARAAVRAVRIAREKAHCRRRRRGNGGGPAIDDVGNRPAGPGTIPAPVVRHRPVAGRGRQVRLASARARGAPTSRLPPRQGGTNPLSGKSPGRGSSVRRRMEVRKPTRKRNGYRQSDDA